MTPCGSDQNDPRRLLETARRAARAGAAALAPFALDRAHLEIASKRANDFVTQADLASERAIAAVIAHQWPAHRLLGEESSDSAAPDSSATDGAVLSDAPTWIVDPLDGTTNFIHGFPVYSISIACAIEQRVVAAVVHDPSRAETFLAARGHGAFVERPGSEPLPLRVTTPESLDGTLIATGFPFRSLERLDRYLDSFRAVVQRVAGVRRAGSAAIDLAYVAAGRFDGFWEERLGPWDMAAGTLLIEEAGGIVSDFAGEDRFLTRGNVVAGGPAVHRELLAIAATHLG